MGCGAANKRVPDFVKQLPPAQIEILLEWLYRGDGHKSKSAETLYTVSTALSNDVQELLLKAGYTFRHRVEPMKTTELATGRFDCHCINWLKKSNDFNIEHKTIKHKKYVEQWEQYNGRVYCATVPNHTLFVRRGGKGVWCGNSLRFYYDGGDEMVNGVVRMAEAMSAYTCEECAKPGGRAGDGWIRTLCKQCDDEFKAARKKRFGE